MRASLSAVACIVYAGIGVGCNSLESRAKPSDTAWLEGAVEGIVANAVRIDNDTAYLDAGSTRGVRERDVYAMRFNKDDTARVLVVFVWPECSRVRIWAHPVERMIMDYQWGAWKSRKVVLAAKMPAPNYLVFGEWYTWKGMVPEAKREFALALAAAIQEGKSEDAHEACLCLSECSERMGQIEEALEYAQQAKDRYEYKHFCGTCILYHYLGLDARIKALQARQRK